MPPTKKWEPYDPQRWAGTDFGMGSATLGVVDVDMDGAEAAPSGAGESDSTSHPGVRSADAGVNGENAPASPKAKSKPKQKNKKKVTVEDEEDEGEERHIATGAITRVRRRRKEWARRGGEDVGPTYNLHLGPNGTQHRDIPGILLG